MIDDRGDAVAHNFVGPGSDRRTGTSPNESIETETADYVIVGAGSAGCVMAGRLSAAGRARVAVLEAGASDRSLWVRMPIGCGGAFHHPRLNGRYQSEPDAGLGGRASYWPRGKVLGGLSSIDAMVFVSGQSADFDRWAARGNPGWAHADVLPLFRAMEDNLAGEDDWRGRGGPLTVTSIDASAHPLTHRFVVAAEAAGLRRNPDFNGATQEGVGFYQITTRRGLRCSAASAYLRPALGRANLRLVTRAHATRLLLEGRRVVGVEYRRGGRTRRMRARREVILSAGAVNSPQILQLSGVGDAGHLRGLGIAPVHDAPGVGRNLQDHIGLDYVYEATCPTLNDVLGPWRGRVAAGMRYGLRRDGPLSLCVNQGGGFVRSAAGRARPNIQLYFSPLSYTRAVPKRRRLMSPDRFPGFMLGLSNCHSRSRGALHVRSADPNEPPRIEPGYLGAPEDLDELVGDAALLRRIAAQAPLRDVTGREILPGPEVTEPSALVEDIRRRASTVFHPCGTCAMGSDAAEGAVVDARLRVHGVGGVRVVDASIFPEITTGSINAPTIMVAEKGAQMVLEDRG